MVFERQTAGSFARERRATSLVYIKYMSIDRSAGRSATLVDKDKDKDKRMPCWFRLLPAGHTSDIHCTPKRIYICIFI